MDTTEKQRTKSQRDLVNSLMKPTGAVQSSRSGSTNSIPHKRSTWLSPRIRWQRNEALKEHMWSQELEMRSWEGSCKREDKRNGWWGYNFSNLSRTYHWSRRRRWTEISRYCMRTHRASQSSPEKKASDQSMLDALGDCQSLSHRCLLDTVGQLDRQRRVHNDIPEVMAYSIRNNSPVQEAKQSLTVSEGVGPVLRGSHSSLSHIGTVTTVSDTSHIVDWWLFESTAWTLAPPNCPSHTHGKSLSQEVLLPSHPQILQESGPTYPPSPRNPLSPSSPMSSLSGRQQATPVMFVFYTI